MIYVCHLSLFGLSLQLQPYFVYAISEGSGESEHSNSLLAYVIGTKIHCVGLVTMHGIMLYTDKCNL